MFTMVPFAGESGSGGRNKTMNALDLLAQAHWALVNTNDKANIQLTIPAIEAIEDYLTLKGWKIGAGGRLVHGQGWSHLGEGEE